MKRWLFRRSPRAWMRSVATTRGRSCPRARPSTAPTTRAAGVGCGRYSALVAEVEGTAKDLLRVVSIAAVAGKSVTFEEAARELGREAEDLLLAVRSINGASAGTNRPQTLGLGGHAGDSSFGSLPFVLADGLAPPLTAQLS